MPTATLTGAAVAPGAVVTLSAPLPAGAALNPAGTIGISASGVRSRAGATFPLADTEAVSLDGAALAPNVSVSNGYAYVTYTLPGDLSDQSLPLAVTFPTLSGGGAGSVSGGLTLAVASGTGVSPASAPAYTGPYLAPWGVGDDVIDGGDHPFSLAGVPPALAHAPTPPYSGLYLSPWGLGDEAIDLGDSPYSAGAAGSAPVAFFPARSYQFGPAQLGILGIGGIGTSAGGIDLVIPLLTVADAGGTDGTTLLTAATALPVQVGLSADGVTVLWLPGFWLPNGGANPVPSYWAAVTLDGTQGAGALLVSVRTGGQAQTVGVVTLA